MGLGCRSAPAPHRADRPVHPRQVGFWIWNQDSLWHLRVSPGSDGRAHRFQGSIVGLAGGIAELAVTRPELHDRVAVVGDTVQFDLESVSDDGLDGFDARILGGCARFELYLDGRLRPEQVHLGAQGVSVKRLPFERCP